MGGSSPSYYLATSSYIQVVGGSRAGTLSSWMDLPGYVLATSFFRAYPRLLAGSGGWSAVLGRLQLYMGIALGCAIAFHVLELRRPTTSPDPRLLPTPHG
jgi:hypothetical protein